MAASLVFLLVLESANKAARQTAAPA